MLVESGFNAASEKEQKAWLSECIQGKTFMQIMAILDKELNANHEQWEKPVAVFLWFILSKTCKDSA